MRNDGSWQEILRRHGRGQAQRHLSRPDRLNAARQRVCALLGCATPPHDWRAVLTCRRQRPGQFDISQSEPKQCLRFPYVSVHFISIAIITIEEPKQRLRFPYSSITPPAVAGWPW
jgi:hypothetical protein